jgi:hypothetical protein
VFRQVLSGLIVPLNDVVDAIQNFEVVPTGSIKIISSASPGGIPLTTFDGTPSSAKVVTGAIGFEFTNEQLGKFEVNNINWRVMAGAANFNIVDQYLDRVAFLGDTVYGLPGLAALSSGPASVTLGTKAAGGLTWAVATHEEIVLDIIAMSDAVTNGSYGRLPGDTVLIPSTQYDRAASVVNTYSRRTAIQEAQDRRPEIRRIIKVSHLTGAGSGSTNRLVGMCSGQDVLTFGERPFRDEPIHPMPLGGLVPSTFRTSGVIVEQAQGLAYGDGC